MCVECTCFLSGEWNSHHNEHCPVSIVREKDERIRELECEVAASAAAFAERDIERHNRIVELEQENAKLRERIAELEQLPNMFFGSVRRWEGKVKELLAELRLRRHQMSQFPFCPDHRDKVHGLECRECEVEKLRAEFKRRKIDLSDEVLIPDINGYPVRFIELPEPQPASNAQANPRIPGAGAVND